MRYWYLVKIMMCAGWISLSIITRAGAVLVESEVIDLSSKSSPYATIATKGGRFSAAGWTSTTIANNMFITLKKAISANEWAAVELHVTNFDLSKNVRRNVTNFFGVHSSSVGTPKGGTPGPFVHLHVKGQSAPESEGIECRINGTYGQGMRAIYKAKKGGGKLENMGRICCDTGWNASKTYRFRMEFKKNVMVLYRNDVRIWGIPHYVRAGAMKYICVGFSKSGFESNGGKRDHGSFPGALYKKVIVYRDNGTPEPPDPAFLRDTIRINAGGFDDMVPGWISDVEYAVKGIDYQWYQAFSIENVANAAPVRLYQTVRHKNHDYDRPTVIFQDSVEMKFPVPDGTWLVRLHFIDILIPEKRSIDLELNGVKVIDNMDIRTEAGSHLRALVKEAPVTITGNRGLTVTIYDDVNNPSGDYLINGLELIKNGTPGTGVHSPDAIPSVRVNTGIQRRDARGVRIRANGIASGPSRARIVDVTGRCLCRRNIFGSGETMLTVPRNPGWYMVQLQHREKTVESRVMIVP